MIKLLTVEGDPKVPLPHVPVPHPYPAVALSGPGLIYGFTVADPVADVVPDEAVAMVIVNSFAAEVITSKVFVSKSAARYPVPVGGVTDVKVNKSPNTLKRWRGATSAKKTQIIKEKGKDKRASDRMKNSKPNKKSGSSAVDVFKSYGKYDGKPCARQPGQKSTPKCTSSSKRSSMSDKERDSAARRKRAADPNQPQKSGAAKPTNVSTDPKRKMKENYFNRNKVIEGFKGYADLSKSHPEALKKVEDSIAKNFGKPMKRPDKKNKGIKEGKVPYTGPNKEDRT